MGFKLNFFFDVIAIKSGYAIVKYISQRNNAK